MSNSYQSFSHSKWDCKYHIVFVPKYRKKSIFGDIRRYLGPIFHELASQKECRIVEGHLMRDHVHICIEIPPKHSVSSVIGFIKGKSAIAIARQFGGKKRNFNGESFWQEAMRSRQSAMKKLWCVAISENRRGMMRVVGSKPRY